VKGKSKVAGFVATEKGKEAAAFVIWHERDRVKSLTFIPFLFIFSRR
jgi:hypothetical protein